MTYAEISPTMRAFLGVFEGLRKMGFRSDDIYCQSARSVELGGALAAYCTLRTQGKEFSVFAGPVESEAAMAAEYRAVAQAVLSHAVPQADLDRIWCSN